MVPEQSQRQPVGGVVGDTVIVSIARVESMARDRPSQFLCCRISLNSKIYKKKWPIVLKTVGSWKSKESHTWQYTLTFGQ